MILPGFDEEEYMNRLKDDEDVADDVMAPSNEGVQLTKEVGETTTEVAPLPNEATQLTKEAG